MTSSHSWKDGEWDRYWRWRHDVVWRMKRRIFNSQRWSMPEDQTRQLHEWIDDFAKAPAAGVDGRAVSLSAVQDD